MQLKDLANLTDTLQILNKSVNIADAFNTLSLSMQKAVLASGQLSAEQLDLIATSNIFSKSINGNKAAVSGLTLEEVKNTASNALVAESQAGTTATTLGLGTAFKGLWIAIKKATVAMVKFLFTTPQGWGVLAVGAIAAVLFGIKKYNDSIEEAKQKTREAADEAKSVVDSIKSDFEALSSDTDKVKERYAELAQQVENLGKVNQSRGKLSTEDYEEFLGLSNQLVKLFPQLRAGCDDNGNAILNLSGNVDTIVGSLNNLIEVQQRLANQEIMKEMPDIWSGYMLDIKEYKEGLSYLEDLETQSKNAVEAISRIWDDKTLSIELYKDSQYQADEKAIDDIIAEAFKKLCYTEQDLEKIRNERIYSFVTDNGTRMQTEINWDLSSLNHLQFKQFQNELITLSKEYENTMMFAKSKIASANSEMVSYINTWLSYGSGGFNFNQMNSDMQNVVRDVLLNSDWISSIPDDVNADDWDAVSDWLQRDFLVAINNIDSEGIQTALVDAFKGNISADTLQGIVDKLMSTEGFEENNPLVIYLRTKIEDRSNLEDDVKSKVRTEYRNMIASLSNGELQIVAEQIEVPEDALLSWDELIAKIEEIKKANITPATFDITIYKDQIDDFQSKLKSLGDALSSIRSSNFEDSDLTDLLQEFPELADKTDDLENAIVELINNALQTLYNTLGEDIPDSLKTSLQELADIASGTAKHLGDAFSSIHDSWDILHDFKDTMDKGFDSNVTDSLLQSVRKLSGELETLVAGYYSGVVTAEQLYEALEKHYENDLRNYSEALIKKNELNEDFYNAIGLASEKVTNQFMDDYGIDLKNCKNYNQAKLEIEQQTLGKIGSMWSKYYDVASQTYTQEMLDLRELEKSTPNNAFVLIDGEAKNKKQMLQEQILKIENYKAAMEALNNITYDGIRSNFEGIGSRLSASSTKDFEGTLDWIEQAIKSVEKEVKELDEVVNSAYSTFFQKNEALAKEIGKVSEEIALQQKAYEEYMRKADSIGLSDDYKNLIRDGAINIENITDENLQKKISDYQQWYEKAVDVSEAISDLNEQMKDLHVKGYELQAERLEDLLDSNSITEKQYLAEMESLYKKYYENQVEYAQKAHEAKLALLEKEKSYLNSVANAASSLLDKEIDTIRDNAELQEEHLKKQIELIEDRKKPLQDELDALEDKVRKEELALNLQKAQYDLAKAENQRTKLVKYMPDAIVI